MIKRIDLLEPELYALIGMADNLCSCSHDESYDAHDALNTLVNELCVRMSEKHYPEQVDPHDKPYERERSVEYRKMILDFAG